MYSLLSVAILVAMSLAYGHPGPSQRLEQITPRQTPAFNFTDYVYVYFTGEQLANGEQVYMAVSNNNNPGSWTTLKGGQPVLTSALGTKGIRDPSLIIPEDRSKYYLIATDLKVNGIGWDQGFCFTCNGSKSIVVWESTDLTHWTEPALRQVSPPNAGMTWAPDAIWDSKKEQYMVFWSSKINGAMTQLRCWTSDFKTFSPPESFVTLGMDNTIALEKSSKKYYMLSKNGPGELIQENVATSLDGPWVKVSEQIGKGTMPAGEGPLVFQNNLDPKKWHLWVDDYTRGGKYIPFETTDLAGGKWTASQGFKLPANPRHGYVVPITAAEREALLAM